MDKTLKGKFKPSSVAERQFYRQLKKVAQASGHIIDTHTSGATITNEPAMTKALEEYSKKLGPWATQQAAKMLGIVQRSNKRAYQNKSKILGVAFRNGVGDAEVGMTAASLLFEQVDLIKSIPIEAGLRAQKIALEAALSGTRAMPDQKTIEEFEKEMGLSTEVATSRAMLIARTETARATAAINQARAQSVGSVQYRWHNSGDKAVRPSHRTYKGRPLQGRIFDWDNPPTLDDGYRTHPGGIFNCRCFAEPIFQDE